MTKIHDLIRLEIIGSANDSVTIRFDGKTCVAGKSFKKLFLVLAGLHTMGATPITKEELIRKWRGSDDVLPTHVSNLTTTINNQKKLDHDVLGDLIRLDSPSQRVQEYSLGLRSTEIYVDPSLTLSSEEQPKFKNESVFHFAIGMARVQGKKWDVSTPIPGLDQQSHYELRWRLCGFAALRLAIHGDVLKAVELLKHFGVDYLQMPRLVLPQQITGVEKNSLIAAIFLAVAWCRKALADDKSGLSSLLDRVNLLQSHDPTTQSALSLLRAYIARDAAMAHWKKSGGKVGKDFHAEIERALVNVQACLLTASYSSDTVVVYDAVRLYLNVMAHKVTGAESASRPHHIQNLKSLLTEETALWDCIDPTSTLQVRRASTLAFCYSVAFQNYRQSGEILRKVFEKIDKYADVNPLEFARCHLEAIRALLKEKTAMGAIGPTHAKMSNPEKFTIHWHVQEVKKLHQNARSSGNKSRMLEQQGYQLRNLLATGTAI